MTFWPQQRWQKKVNRRNGSPVKPQTKTNSYLRYNIISIIFTTLNVFDGIRVPASGNSQPLVIHHFFGPTFLAWLEPIENHASSRVFVLQGTYQTRLRVLRLVVNIYHMYLDPEGRRVVICKQRIVVKSRTLYLIAFALSEAIILRKMITLTDINFLNREERNRQRFQTIVM